MGDNINLIFVLHDGSEVPCKAQIGENILSVAKRNDFPLEGTCGGCVACATCHVILEKVFFDKLPEISDEENDMLDMAIGCEEYSRLGCQIVITKELEGMRVRIVEQDY